MSSSFMGPVIYWDVLSFVFSSLYLVVLYNTVSEEETNEELPFRLSVLEGKGLAQSGWPITPPTVIPLSLTVF